MLVANGYRLRGRGLGTLGLSEPSVQPAFPHEPARQVERIPGIAAESDRLGDPLAGCIGPAQDARAKDSETHRTFRLAKELAVTRSRADAAPAREVLFGADEVPPPKAHRQLRQVRESEAGVAALAPGHVEYLVGQRGGADVVARGPNGNKVRSSLKNELKKVATFLGQ